MKSSLLAALPLLALAAPLGAQPVATPPATRDAPAPLASLVRSVDIPYEQFTLPNGLRVLVHTDRKAPVVAVSVWYHIGSKNEPAGKTGFAHLFEHLMFYGSEHAPGDYFKYLQDIGATDVNGTTWYDRTNYFETVPTGALDRALFLESDRMGYLLGGLTQVKLDNQRGVVQNEKRQDDNQPFGTVDYLVNSVLYPPGHPYRHSTIGSMADLNAASLDTVKGWFRDHYGPNNAILALAGDIDVATARAKVTKWFGAIPRGPETTRPLAPIPTLAAPVERVMHDQVPYARVQRNWVVEGVNGRDGAALDVGLRILGGLRSSRLDAALVRGDRSAVSVSANREDFEDVGAVEIQANVRPGQDPAAVAAKLDALIAEFVTRGPTADEVQRAATQTTAALIGGLERTGGFTGKAPILATGLIYSGDPAKYKRDLAEIAALTPARVQAAMKRWLSRPPLKLTVLPGTREDTPEFRAMRGDVTAPATSAGGGSGGARGALLATGGGAYPPVKAGPDRSQLPPVAQLTALRFPAIERTTLANGIPVIFARRSDAPTVRVSVSFNAGIASDPKDAVGTQTLMLSLLPEGAGGRSAQQLAEAQERLGASIRAGASLDRSSVGLFALKPNLRPSLELLADVVRRPDFAPAEFERLRAQQLAGIKASLTDPGDLARYLAGPIVFGPNHPYNVYGRAAGDPMAVARLTRDDVVRAYRDWLTPANATIFVVGDTTLAELKPLLDASFGNWPMDRRARPTKDLSAPIPTPMPTIYLVDRPGSPQAVIRGVEVLPVTGKQDLVELEAANDVLGGGFNNRLFKDLRDTKGWSYGAGSGLAPVEGPVPFVAVAPVQTDKTGASLTEMIKLVSDFVGPNGVTAEELRLSVNGAVRELPGRFETSDALIDALQQITFLGRPDDYYVALPRRLQALSAPQLDAAARRAIDPKRMSWIVVGDAKLVRPQLEAVGLPIQVLTPPAVN